MIARTWHGWTAPDRADAYEALLRGTIFPRIVARGMAGLERIELFRRARDHGEVEFMTVMWFDSQEAVTAFVGRDHGAAYVPEEARRVLSRFDKRSAHYEIRQALSADDMRQASAGDGTTT
ncbi:antibiotic biosynthesis monooxygenase [Marinivivus vitaminiproducens]|uniref:antibiotic biosynthesis monooxygenase n=1 Tax=Marinivivus vitaminiproducens TaxID=3035935 RepID=UPI00279AA8DF|nr:hypothetical protein P4R82_05365 [Geminicoccaceae bacterium SCSIO 64248]